MNRTLIELETAIKAVYAAVDLLPAGKHKATAQAALSEAERALQNAEAAVADLEGYRLCHNHFPPGIMRQVADLGWICPICGSVKAD